MAYQSEVYILRPVGHCPASILKEDLEGRLTLDRYLELMDMDFAALKKIYGI